MRHPLDRDDMMKLRLLWEHVEMDTKPEQLLPIALDAQDAIARFVDRLERQ